MTFGGLLAKKRSSRAKADDRLLDLARGVGRVHAGIDRDAAIEPAPGRHRGGPVAALDLADVEVDRVRIVGEMLVRVAALVPGRLEPAQRRDDPVGGVDGVRAGAHVAHMDRVAAHLDLETRARRRWRARASPPRAPGSAPHRPCSRADASSARRCRSIPPRRPTARRRSRPAAARCRLSASSAKRFAAWPAFMSPAPRPYIQSPSITGSKGGWRHMSSGPAGTTSTCACRISERPLSSFGRWMPTTIGASECSGENFEPPGWRSIAARSIANRSMAKPRSRSGAEDEILDRMLLAAQRAEADEVLVKAICSTKPASTEAMMRSRRAASSFIRCPPSVSAGVRLRPARRI